MFRHFPPLSPRRRTTLAAYLSPGSFAARTAAIIIISLTKLEGFSYAADPEAPHIHIILAIDTLAERADTLGIKTDGARMLSLLTTGLASHVNDGTLHVTVLAGRELTPESVLHTINILRSGPNDTIFFYYSGHGAMAGAPPTYWDLTVGYERWQAELHRDKRLLTMSSGNLARAALKSAIERKPCRLSVVLTDCCAGYTRRPSPTVAARAPTAEAAIKDVVERIPSGSDRANARALETLFCNHIGSVDYNAATNGQFAHGSKPYGGYFTFCLARVLAQNDEDFRRTRDNILILITLPQHAFTTWESIGQMISHELGNLPPLVAIAQREHKLSGQSPAFGGFVVPLESPIEVDGQLGICLAQQTEPYDCILLKVLPGGTAERHGRLVLDRPRIERPLSTGIYEVEEFEGPVPKETTVKEIWDRLEMRRGSVLRMKLTVRSPEGGGAIWKASVRVPIVRE